MLNRAIGLIHSLPKKVEKSSASVDKSDTDTKESASSTENESTSIEEKTDGDTSPKSEERALVSEEHGQGGIQ